MAKKLCVNNMCIACSICVHEAPNTFELQEDIKNQSMVSAVINQNGDDSDKVRSAINKCPVTAIFWKEEN